jgi:hypothetical protein
MNTPDGWVDGDVQAQLNNALAMSALDSPAGSKHCSQPAAYKRLCNTPIITLAPATP